MHKSTHKITFSANKLVWHNEIIVCKQTDKIALRSYSRIVLRLDKFVAMAVKHAPPIIHKSTHKITFSANKLVWHKENIVCKRTDKIALRSNSLIVLTVFVETDLITFRIL